MTILRMSVIVLSITFSANAFSQADHQSNYQCSSGTSLKDGFLVYKTGSLRAVAKHQDGTISQISGVIGRLQERSDLSKLSKGARSVTPAQLAQFNDLMKRMEIEPGTPAYNLLMNLGSASGKMDVNALVRDLTPRGWMGGGPPDRDDIETTPTRSFGPKPGELVGPRQGDMVDPKAGARVGLREGDRVGPRRGDQVSAIRAGDFSLREGPPSKDGDLVLKPGVTVFSAQIDPQGKINNITFRSNIAFRSGSEPATIWRAGAENSPDAESVYLRLNSDLDNIKSRAYCCTQNPGANCGDVAGRATAQSSLRTEKSTFGQKVQSVWSDMIKSFKPSSASEAK